MKKIVKTAIFVSIRLFKVIYWMMLDTAYRLNLMDAKKIPVIINNFNRLTHLQKLIHFLEKYGYTNVVILDNNSTYPPLLEFYDHCNVKVIRKKTNYGHLALWKSGLFSLYKWNYFVYTDSDVLPVEECPADFMEYFRVILSQDLRLDKVGFGIKIDDLPSEFLLKDKVVAYEKRYWMKEVKENIFEAAIDTTFALYKPMTGLKSGHSFTHAAQRTGHPYLLRHMPWYVNSANLSKEDLYYQETSNDSSSLSKQEKNREIVY